MVIQINFIFDGVQRIDRVISSLINYSNKPTITLENKYEIKAYLKQKEIILNQELNKKIKFLIKEHCSKPIQTKLRFKLQILLIVATQPYTVLLFNQRLWYYVRCE